MKIFGKIVKPAVIFYLLAAYILAQFTWWAYLLASLNEKLFMQKKALADAGVSSGSEHLKAELRNQLLMVFGEGVVFLFLLLLGFYLMFRSLRREVALARQERNFLLSVTHELKSPLSSAKLYLQTLMQRDLDKITQNKVLGRALNDTERLKGLVDNLLLATRIENRNYRINPERVDLSAYIAGEADRLKDITETRDRLELQVEDRVYARIDKSAFSSILTNLVENALKYDPGNGRIVIGLRSEPGYGKALFWVEDEGPGIPPHSRKKVFDKFVRLGNEETRQTRGTGLGLYIVNKLVVLQGGVIGLLNAESGKGLRVEIGWIAPASP